MLDEDFRQEDFSSDNGFIEAYSEDINRPYLDGHIFLMYKFFDGNEKHVERDIRFTHMKTFHSRKVIRINKISYILYTFCAFGDEILRIRQGFIPMGKKNKMKIFMFWGIKDEFINRLVFSRMLSFDKSGISVPEEDYMPQRLSAYIMPDMPIVKHAM